MLVSFEYCNKIIANAELSMIPFSGDTIKIWGKEMKLEIIDRKLKSNRSQAERKQLSKR